jgi:hypothetical protein
MSRRKQNQEYDGFASDDNKFDKSEPSASDENIEAILQAGLDSIKNEQSVHSDLTELRYQIEMSSSRKERNFMSQLQNKFKSHPRFSLIFASAVAMLLFTILVPFSYQKTIGYQVEYAVGDASQVPSAEVINTALAAIGQNEAKATFTYSENTGKCLISVLPNMHAVRETQALIASIMGTFSDPKVSPIVEIVSGSLYAQAKDKVIKVEVDGSNKTDEQIQDEIKSKLEAQGFKGTVVYVKSNRDEVGSDSSKQIKFEMTVKGNCCIADSNATGANMQCITIDGRGKTAEQIEAEVKQRLAEKGMGDASIKVKVTGDSSDTTQKRQIQIEIKDEENK